MNPKLSAIAPKCLNDKHLQVVAEQFPPDNSSVTYLNSGSVGRKPKVVLSAVNEGFSRFNENPTWITYFESKILEDVRAELASMYKAEKESILLLDSTSLGLQLILQSFLKTPSDELVMTNREHSSSNTVARHLEESRGVRVRKQMIDGDISSEKLCIDLLNLVTGHTKIVLVSEVDCLTGWKPDYTLLIESLKLLDIPLLIDGAHAPGNVPPAGFKSPLFVGACHKWLGAPNTTAFAYIDKHLIPKMEPVWLGGGHFDIKDNEIYDLRRFECKGNIDPVKWLGAAEAIKLYRSLDPEHIFEYQNSLARYARDGLAENFGVSIRPPGFTNPDGEEQGSMVAFYTHEGVLKTDDLRKTLWEKHKIWIQPDFLGRVPETGGRVSCHYSCTKEDVDKFLDTLKQYIN